MRTCAEDLAPVCDCSAGLASEMQLPAVVDVDARCARSNPAASDHCFAQALVGQESVCRTTLWDDVSAVTNR